MNKHNEIENLLERFFEGMTSNQEEKLLYTFFSQKNEDIPKHLHKYKPIFKYFEKEIINEAEICKEVELPPCTTIEQSKNRKLYAIVSIAASIILFVFSLQLLFNNKGSNESDLYEGSYIVKDGVRITDLELIKSELEKSERFALAKQEKVEQVFSKIQEEEEIIMLAEQQIKKQFDILLDQVHDEYVQNEIKKILDIENKNKR